MKHTYRVHYDKANGFRRPWLAIITKPRRKWEFHFIPGNYVKTSKGAMKALDFVIETAGIAPGALFAFGVSDNPAYGCGKQRVHGTILPSGEIRWLPGTARFDIDEVAELLCEPRHWSDTVPKFDHGVCAELAPAPAPAPAPAKDELKDLRAATFGLLDYWFIKYKPACEDEDERRVWQAVIDNLTPNEPTK